MKNEKKSAEIMFVFNILFFIIITYIMYVDYTLGFLRIGLPLMFLFFCMKSLSLMKEKRFSQALTVGIYSLGLFVFLLLMLFVYTITGAILFMNI